MKEKRTILNTCLHEFGMTLTEFSKATGINRSTMDGWLVRGKVSPLGKITLSLLLENKRLKNGYDAESSGFKYCPCCGQEVKK